MISYHFSAFEKTNRNMFGKKKLDARKQSRTDHGTKVELSRTPLKRSKVQ